MGTVTKFETPSGWTSVLTTELNSLAADGVADSTTTISNGTSKALFSDWEVSLASLNPTGNAMIGLRLRALTSDGSTYENSGSNAHVRSIAVSTGSSTKLVVIKRVVLLPGDFRASLVNWTNVSLAASGNTLKYRLYSLDTP